MIDLHLNARLQPFIRHDIEDAIYYILEENALGEIVGGGTEQAESGEILTCDINIKLAKGKTVEELLNVLEGTFEFPKGSTLNVENKKLQIGNLDGLALYLDAVNLEEDIYENNDINDVIDILSEKLDDELKLFAFWEGAETTALYFYVDSYEVSKEIVEEVIAAQPLCKNSKIEKIA